jgi:hypothetical protein
MAEKLWLDIDREFSRQISQHLWIRTDRELTTKLDDLLNEELEEKLKKVKLIFSKPNSCIISFLILIFRMFD